MFDGKLLMEEEQSLEAARKGGNAPTRLGKARANRLAARGAPWRSETESLVVWEDS